MSKLLTVIAMCCIYSANLHASQKNNPSKSRTNKSWAQTSLTPEQLSNEFLTPEHCLYSQRSFVGCFFAISEIIKSVYGDNARLSLKTQILESTQTILQDGPFQISLLSQDHDSLLPKRRVLKNEIQRTIEVFFKDKLSSKSKKINSLLSKKVNLQIQLEKIQAQFTKDMGKKPDPSEGEIAKLWASQFEPAYESTQTKIDNTEDSMTHEIEATLDDLNLNSFFLLISDSFYSIPKEQKNALAAQAYNIYLQYVSDGHASIQPSHDLQKNTAGKAQSLTIKDVVKHRLLKRSSVTYDVLEISTFQAPASFQPKEELDTLPICNEIKRLLKERETKTQGWIIDLRNNPGGLISEATCSLDLFLDKDLPLIFQGQDAPKDLKKYQKSLTPAISKKTMAVWINQNSASAAELFAGVIQSHGRGIIIGQRSFGKGSFQKVSVTTHPLFRQWKTYWYAFSDISYIETAGLYYLPTGQSPQWSGIEPDIKVKNLENPSSIIREKEMFPRGLKPKIHSSKKWIRHKMDLSKCISQHEESNKMDSKITMEASFSKKTQDSLECLAKK